MFKKNFFKKRISFANPISAVIIGKSSNMKIFPTTPTQPQQPQQQDVTTTESQKTFGRNISVANDNIGNRQIFRSNVAKLPNYHPYPRVHPIKKKTIHFKASPHIKHITTTTAAHTTVDSIISSLAASLEVGSRVT